MRNCDHKFIPAVDLSLGFGSLGSQIGYACAKCHELKVLWPKGHVAYGSEEEIVQANIAITQSELNNQDGIQVK